MTEIESAPAITWALVTITPSLRTRKPDPRPGVMRVPAWAPNICDRRSGSTRSTMAVCTVTTAGATAATAVVIALRRPSDTEAAGVDCACCADEGDGCREQPRASVTMKTRAVVFMM